MRGTVCFSQSNGIKSFRILFYPSKIITQNIKMVHFSLPSPGPSACLLRGNLSLPIIGVVLVTGHSRACTGPVLSHMGLCHI